MGYDWAKWVRHKIEKGEAIVRPVGYHKGVERLQGFRSRLDACRDIEELEGFANRRKFDPELPKWNASERDAILRRKFEMENSGNERRKKK
jgi:hypothetical protein